jgi:ABC-type glycerol-3-phosphate transport system substrate-binding protein
MKRFLQCIFTFLALLSVLSCASTGTSADTKGVKAKLGAAIRDNQTIEIHILRDTWEAQTNGQGDNTRFRALSEGQMEKITDLISSAFKSLYPDKTITVVPVSYSNSSEYQKNVIEQIQGDKLVVLYSVETFTEAWRDSSTGRVNETVSVYSGVDFYDAKAQSWIAAPGQRQANHSIFDMLSKDLKMSTSIFEVSGTGTQDDGNPGQRAMDQYMQNLQPETTKFLKSLNSQS